MRVLWVALCAVLLWPAAGVAAVQGRDVADATPLIVLEPVLDGLDVPVFVTHAGDGSGRLFIVERGGLIRVMVDGALLEDPFLDLRGVSFTDDDKQGLLGLAFHPDYAENGAFFVVYTAADGSNVLARYHVSADPNLADPAGDVLLSIPDRDPDHNLGMLAFGPDGYLYLSTGDEGGNGDPFGNAQNLGTLHGKVLRIAVGSSGAYSVPDDNPFVGVGGARPEIWAYGLRSPWRFSFDRATGDLFIADVGEARWEEINYQPATSSGGENYGWNHVEGLECFPPGSECNPDAYSQPIHAYTHAVGCSVTGGYVYRGVESPLLAGAYVFGDFCTGVVSTLQQADNGTWQRTDWLDTDLLIASFGEDEAGEIYLADMRYGRIFRLVVRADVPAPVVTGVVPGELVAGSDSTTLQVWGSGFTPESVVLWNGSPRETTWRNSALLQITPRAGDVRAAGVVEVRVRNPAPGGDSNAAVLRITPPGFADAAFAGVWERSDLPVATGEVSRTWLWGPAPNTGLLLEPYEEAPEQVRVVQYFDKARMEITYPDGDRSNPWYVTTGLLVVELVTGKEQVGDALWLERAPAEVNVAGDLDDPTGPTYATIGMVLDAPAAALGSPIIERLARDGSRASDPALLGHGVTAAAYDDLTGHSIASVFWDALNPADPADDDVFGGLYAIGRPIAEPYWARVAVAGEPRDVLLQCFERRCLTWTPDNPAGWQIEAGNVGLHYFRWRYVEREDAPSP